MFSFMMVFASSSKSKEKNLVPEMTEDEEGDGRMKKKPVLIVKGEETKWILEKQLSSYFEPYCEIESYSVDQTIKPLDHADMVLFSSRFLINTGLADWRLSD
ncbi:MULTISPECIES: hypothetical protein [Brevibacillus]|uniref:hypothetical protein n=1 Tax=Brevibacillus TaxID=55080 RepID=UPI00203E144C|nr:MULTISPECIES: hypothetical protein [Brevibacillus]MCM3429826.1 hypothetical protein [Brevibacillus invocatus]MDH4617021.1 hypothetical protein [Brevibacillus sp. AY1]